MESVWYYVSNGAQVGPVSLTDLKAAAAAGQVSQADLVWQEGTPDWVAARTVAGLFSATPPAPPASQQPTYSLSPPPPALAPEPLPLEPLPLDDEPVAPRPRSRPRRDDGVPPAGTPEWVKLVQVFLLRVVDANLLRVKPEPDEDAALTRSGVMDATSRKFAVWRRAMLFVAAVPCAFAALFGLITLLAMDKEDREGLSAFGMFLLYVQALSLFALPAAAVLGALAYDRLAASARWVLIGGLVSFVPLAVVFVPGDWIIELKTTSTTTVQQLEEAKAGIRVILGVVFYLMVVPTVLSLLPAVSRACVRLKLLLPESIVPGWGLVASSPLCVILTLTTFVLLYHLAGNVLLLLGLFLWIGAPLVYFTKFNLLTKPVSAPAEQAALARTSLVVFALVASGIVLLLFYAFVTTIPLAGKTLVGFDEKTSILRPWSLEIHKRLIEYAGRSLFLSVFFCDLVLWMMLSVWREERAFAGSAQAAAFDRTMTGLSSAVLPRGSAPPAP